MTMRWIGVAATAIAVGAGPASAAHHPSTPLDANAPIPGAQRAAMLTASASAALGKGEAAKAVQDAEAAVMLRPNDAGLRALLGRAYLAAGRFHSADAALGDALTLDPSLTHALMNRALTQIALGNADGAKALLTKAEGVAPAAEIGLAQALLGDTEGARHRLDAAARAPGADVRTRQNLGLVDALDGRWDDAVAIAQQDVPPDQMPQRMHRWAMIAQMKADPAMQVGAILGVLPAADPGQPAALALAVPVPAPAPVAAPVALAEAVSAPAAAPVTPVTPAPVPVVAPVTLAKAGPAPVAPPVASAAPAPAPAPVVAPVVLAEPAPTSVPAPALPAPPTALSAVVASVQPVARVEDVAVVALISPVSPPLEIGAVKLPTSPLVLSDLHAVVPETLLAVASPIVSKPAGPVVAAVIAPAPVQAEAPKSVAWAGPPRMRNSKRVPASQVAAASQPAKLVIANGAPVATAAVAKSGILLASQISLKPAPAAAMGNWAVQLGAFSTLEHRETAWSKLSAKAAFLGTYAPTGSGFRFGKATLYRLSVSGLPTRAEAVSLCVKIKAAGGACFVRNMSGDEPMRWAVKKVDAPVKLAVS